MKTTSPSKLILTTMILSAVLPCLAQPKPNERPQRPVTTEPNGNRSQFNTAGMRGGAGAFNLFFNVMTDEQRESFRQASEGQRDKIRDLEEKLRDARKAVIEASIAEKIDEDGIRKKFMDAAKVDAELTVLRAKALSQIKPPLSKEQLEKIKNPQPFDGARGRFGDRESPKPIEPGRDKNDLPPAPQPK